MIVGFFLILHDAITDRKVTIAVVLRILFASVGGIGVYTLLWTRRTFILWAMLSIFVMYFLSKEKRPRLTAIAMFGLALFMALQLAISYRPYLHLGSTTADLGEVELEAANSVASQEGDEFDSFLAIVNLYPEYFDYDYFGIYLRMPLHPIPRLLWADKPPLFNASWDAFLFQSGITWGASESLVGDLYVQLGVIGVIIGMVFSGVLWRFVYAYLMKAPDRRFMQLVFAVAVGNIPSYIMQSAISAFWKWFPLMIPGVIFAYWISRRRSLTPSLAQPIIQGVR
jgi:oligosaccharide repeat unit polymerase